jgi:hypothetical protein
MAGGVLLTFSLRLLSSAEVAETQNPDTRSPDITTASMVVAAPAEASKDGGSLPDPQCVGKSDFTRCTVVTKPDRAYDICVNRVCVSPGCGDASCNVPGPHFPLADTNQRSCYSNKAKISCPALPCDADHSQAFCGQDAQYRRGAKQAPTARFAKDTSVSGQPVVLDKVTGLMWQGCTQGLYGDECDDGDDETASWQDSVAKCDALSWGGYKDWRLSDEYELMSHVTYGQNSSETNVDSHAFPNTPADYFWASSSRVLDDHVAWGMFLGSGYMNSEAGKISKMYSRCVRGGPATARSLAASKKSGDRLVSDALNRLTWQGCVVGLSGDKCDKGTALAASWVKALASCEALNWGGYQGWRLPNVVELRSLVKNSIEDPSIDAQLFPATPNEFTWSSTSRADRPSYAWGVSFGYGFVHYYGKSDTKLGFVRCVRDQD